MALLDSLDLTMRLNLQAVSRKKLSQSLSMVFESELGSLLRGLVDQIVTSVRLTLIHFIVHVECLTSSRITKLLYAQMPVL